MNCSQILPGAVNPGPCSLATGYCSGEPFIVYASGCDVILLNGHLQHVQTILGSSCGYGNTKVSSVHCAEKTGRLSVAWGSEVVVFKPISVEDEASGVYEGDNVEEKFLYEWTVTQTLYLKHDVLSMCWSVDGTRLLTGGIHITLWEVIWKLNLPELVEGGEEEEEEGEEEKAESEGVGGQEVEGPVEKLEEVWQNDMSNPVVHLKFSPSGNFFASCGKNECLVKIWYPTLTEGTGSGTPPAYSFCYIAHPQLVRGFVWRRMTTSFPKGCIPNVILTHCMDNVCRIWSHSLSYTRKGHLRFFIAASIDPVADIPFRTTLPLNDQPFIVHWLNNKETTLTSKVEKFQKGVSRPISHFSSVQSFMSNPNEEMLQSWVCIEEDDELNSPARMGGGGGGSGVLTGSKTEVEMTHPSSFPRKSLSLGANLYSSLHKGTSTPTSAGEHHSNSSSVRPSISSQYASSVKISTQHKRALAHLLDEWCSTPDLLLCIHPSVGSLMVWTVEGIDAPPTQERLVHVSFSSCLPHVFPPHLSQSLQPELLQFLINEPDVLHAREATSGEAGGRGGGDRGREMDISLPVPQIRLSSSGSMPTMSHIELAEDVRKVKPDSTLILVSSHSNGSLNTWSVELTVQSNYCTSIAGLIRCAGTGGHRSKVTRIHRHPWLPVLMTISASEVADDGESGGGDSGLSDGGGGGGDVEESTVPGKTNLSEEGVSELIIWNADLPGPLQLKSKVNELSRLTSWHPDSFKHVTWVPPISMESIQKGALARCPSQGLFVANVGSELVLFQASLYSVTKPQPSSFMQSDKDRGKARAAQATSTLSRTLTPSHFAHKVQVTSQLGVKGVDIVSIIKDDLLSLQEIIGLHVFRMCSLVTTTDLKVCNHSKFCKDVVLVLLENRKPPEDSTHLSSGIGSSTAALGSKGTKTYLHVWRLCLTTHVTTPPSPPLVTSQDGTTTTSRSSSANPDLDLNYACKLKKVFEEPQLLPLPPGTFVVESSPACDISSSLQLQTPTLSAPYLFSTACSDGTICCWQFNVEEEGGGEEERSFTDSFVDRHQTPTPGDIDEDCFDVTLRLFEVFGSTSKSPELSGMKPRVIDCLEEDVIRSLPTESYVPVAIKVAYPGRLAMAHLLSGPASSLQQSRTSSPTLRGSNPNDRHAMVTIWECESSGGLQWSCETTLMLVGVGQVAAKKDAGQDMNVLMEWVPMENGAYLLAACFGFTVSVFGMALPQDTEQFAVIKERDHGGLRAPEGRSVPMLTRVKAQASWVCLLEFPCLRRSVDIPISCLAYTGSNSLVVSIGGELQLYSCWVPRDKLTPFNKGRSSVGKFSRSQKSPVPLSQLNSEDLMRSSDQVKGGAVNLLDYAHAWNTPLPQHHPKILVDLMNSGKLMAVKSILINLIRFLLLYRTSKKKVKDDDNQNWGSFDEEEEERFEADVSGKRKRRKQLSLSSEGYLQRSRQTQPKKLVDSIPQLPLSKMGIIGSAEESAFGESQAKDGEGGAMKGSSAKIGLDDYDELFSTSNLESMEMIGDEEDSREPEVTFADLSPNKSEFTPRLSDLLLTLLEDHRLPHLSELDHLQLVSISQTLASTQGNASNSAAAQSSSSDDAIQVSFSTLSGAGYASSSMSSKGREGIDECGLRYLLALESSVALANSLPEGVMPAPLPASSLVWAFHSDAESELLTAIPCVREDRLEWEGLMRAGVGWWLRSVDMLKRLTEKLAKALFMRNQQPLDASLFYLAMKKQSLLKTLFKSVSDTRMATFFSNDFTTDRWKKAAQKNAFALLGKQRFEEAAAFFLLSGKLWDAVEVCMSRLQDYQLAFVIIRLYEGDHGPVYLRFLKECILGMPSESETTKESSQSIGSFPGKPSATAVKYRASLETSPNPFLRSMAHWLLQDYSGALETLLINPAQSEGDSSRNGVHNSDPKHSFLTHPAVFNFYFFLRNHPVLVRRDCKSSALLASGGNSNGRGVGWTHLSSVGEEPLTPVERNLLFSTAYFHLCHGCPLLALNVLQRLPKSSNLGADIFEGNGGSQSQFGSSVQGGTNQGGLLLSGMIQDEGELGSNKRNISSGGTSRSVGGKADDEDFDWGAPVSSLVKQEEDDVDWSQPFSSGALGSGRFGGIEDVEEEFDWSKPVSSSRFCADDNTPELSPTHLDGHDSAEADPRDVTLARAPSILTPWGVFILSLASQLQYNACLSILTEELHSIYVPSCCLFLWEGKRKSRTKKGEDEPILPLTKPKTEASLKLLPHYSENVFDRTLQNLRGMLVDWLKEEAAAVKRVTNIGMESASRLEERGRREDSVNIEDADSSQSEHGMVTSGLPSGYDLLTTLMNYSALHATTSPTLLTVKFELMHLVNTTLPWGESGGAGDSSSAGNPSRMWGDRQARLEHHTPEFARSSSLDPDIVPTLAASPSQLPILTSCSLPVRHLTNLATHLRMLSNCVVQALTSHVYPPISTEPLPQVRKIFELCCAISHCLTVSLNPVQASELLVSRLGSSGGTPTSSVSASSSSKPGKIPNVGSQGSLRRTPTPSYPLVDQSQQQPSQGQPPPSKGSGTRQKGSSPSSQSPFLRKRMDSFSNLDSTIGPPNTKPSKWPGLTSWPAVLTSNEGRDPTHLSVVMVEGIVTVYMGLFATAWSQHSINDLLALLKNAPTMESWYDIVGGGTYTKKAERVVKNLFKQTMESVSKRLHRQTARDSSSAMQEEEMTGVFVAPRRTLLDLFLSPPGEDQEEKEVSRMETTGYYVVGGTEVAKSSDDEEEMYMEEDEEAIGTGITFKVGGAGDRGGGDQGPEETDPSNPNCYAWCLINVCVSKILQQTIRKIVAGVGMEVLELITVSPLLYSVLKLLDEWESIFNRRLEALGEPPEDLFGSDSSEQNSRFKMGVSLMRQKFILEPENSPFRGKDRQSRSARKLWQYLVHQSEPRDTILHYLYLKKPQVRISVDADDMEDTDSIMPVEPSCKVIHKEHDNTISAICINSCSRTQVTVLALALPREVLEIEVQEEAYQDASGLDRMDNGGSKSSTSPTKRASVAHPGRGGDEFIMIQTTGQLHRPPKSTSMSSLFSPTQLRRSLPTLPGLPASFASGSSHMSSSSQQTGSANPVLLRRHIAGVKRMAPHPNLAYFLTGSMDGSVYMWEFGISRYVACPRQSGGAVTKIRFTPEGNKFGVTDHQGNLSLWQGIQTSSKSAYHILHSHMKFLTDFLFLGSSSFIATCGDGPESKNLYLWDTLMPTHRSIVKEFSCHESGATALGYCRSKQRLFCGGKRGEVCIFDIRQRSLLQSVSLHSSSVNCIAVNDIDGYFVSGSADGDIKILDCSTLRELASFPGLHAKTRLFRHGEGGVTDMDILPGGKLYSCGGDGTIKLQTLQFS